MTKPEHVWVGVLAAWLAACSTTQETTQKTSQETAQKQTQVQSRTDPSPHFLIFGDSGYINKPEGKSGLIPVASAMKSHCQQTRCHFAMMAGDNIYPSGADGLGGAEDIDRFEKAFEIPFGDFRTIDSEFRIYMTLGNHDWRQSRVGAFAQIQYAANHPPLYMDGPYYKVREQFGDTTIDVFVIDTEMLLSTLSLDEYDIGDDGIPVKQTTTRPGGKSTAKPQTRAEENQVEWLESALQSSDADWKFILSHHPLWENRGSKFEELLVQRLLVRPVACRYADAYFAGHQHTLELQTDTCADIDGAPQGAPLAHILSGAASKSRAIDIPFMEWQEKTFPEMTTHFARGDAWGYMSGSIKDDRLTIKIYAADEGTMDPNAYPAVKTFTFQKR